MTLRPTAATAGLIVAALGLTACGSGPADTANDGRISVVASTDVWGSVVKAVGGDAVDVTALIDDPAKDPHDYETTSLDVAKVAKAKLVVSNGDGYDDFFAEAVSATGGHPQSIVAYDLSGKPTSSDANEHVFYDLPTVKKVADAAAGRLGALDGTKKATFTANAATFDKKIDELIAQVQQIGTSHPGRGVVVTEPVADYLLELAGVKDATPKDFEEAVEADRDIPAQASAETTALISDKEVTALVDNAQTETGTTNQLKAAASAAGVPVVDVTETFPAGAGDYVDWMGEQIGALAVALSRR